MPALWGRSSRTRRRRSALLGSFLIIFLFVVVLYQHVPSLSLSTPSVVTEESKEIVPQSPLLAEQVRFWRSIYQIVLNNDPQCQKAPEVVVPAQLDIAYQDDHVHNRPDIMWMDEPDIQRMKVAHSNFINDVRVSGIKPVYNKGTRGIITTVSDSSLPILLITLRMIRQTESMLPVEVFLWQASPYTDHICSKILPELNATCVYLSRIFVASATGIAIESYQYKIFAILFSSFDELLFLDADAWPAANPDPLFTLPPFTDTGLVLWPDFWYASESPYFFSIAKIENPPALADRAATEAGEFMYSKSKHELGILLATYYNYYGPEYYYPLQSQGAPGQGDKETFGLAAMAVGEEFYSVKTMVTALGRGDSSGQWLGSAMVQYDPFVDFQTRNVKLGQDSGSAQNGDNDDHHDHEKETQASLASDLDSDPNPLSPLPVEELTYQSHSSSPPSIVKAATDFTNLSHTSPKPLFIHANFPKFDPRTIFHETVNGAHTPTRDTNGTNVRCWGMTSDVATERFGYDVEQRFWGVIWKVACEDLVGGKGRDKKESDNGKGEKEREVCRQVEAYVGEIFPALDLSSL